MLKFCMTAMLIIELAIILILMQSNAEMVFSYEREQKNHDTSISFMRDICDEKVSRMLMQKCAEEEMPGGGGMKLEFGSGEPLLVLPHYQGLPQNNIIELPPEWGIGNIHLLDG